MAGIDEYQEMACRHKWLPYSYKASPTNVSPSYWILEMMVCSQCTKLLNLNPQATKDEKNHADQ